MKWAVDADRDGRKEGFGIEERDVAFPPGKTISLSLLECSLLGSALGELDGTGDAADCLRDGDGDGDGDGNGDGARQ